MFAFTLWILGFKNKVFCVVEEGDDACGGRFWEGWACFVGVEDPGRSSAIPPQSQGHQGAETKGLWAFVQSFL